MTITQELNQIITKYNIDRWYPRFQKKLCAEEIVCEVFDKEIQLGKNIVLVGTRSTDVEQVQSLLDDRNVIFQSIVIDVEEKEQKKLSKINPGDCVWLISFHDQEIAIDNLEELHIPYNNLYDVFLSKGLLFEDEYYNVLVEEKGKAQDYRGYVHTSLWYEQLQKEFYYQNRKYQSSKEETIKKIALEKQLFLALYAKNFIQVKECLDKLNKLDNNPQYENMWKEVQELINRIKNNIRKKDTRDIIIYWLDAISFSEEGNDFLDRMKEQSVSFQNAFSVMPWTHPTFRYMFLGSKNKLQNLFDSMVAPNVSVELIDYFEEQNYKFKLIGGFSWGSYLKRKYKMLNDPYIPLSMKIWSALEHMTEKKEKQVILVHSLVETHFPYLSFRMAEADFNNIRERLSAGMREVNELLDFYKDFFGKEAVQIFMSDHGGMFSDFRERFHIHMHVYSPKMKPKKIYNMFSVVDFKFLIQQIIEKGEIEENLFTREYAPIENLDRYRTSQLKDFLENKEPLEIQYFGYKGAITKNEFYVRFSNDKEYLVKRENPFVRPKPCDESIIDSSLDVEYFRKVSGVYPKEVMGRDGYDFSKFWSMVYECYIQRITGIDSTLNNMLLKYPNKSVAIRMGGNHSYHLYSMLSEESKEKVIAFVDNNPNCRCITHEKEVWSVEQFMEKKPQAVLLSSYDFAEELREEAKRYPKDVQVLDLYKIFEQNGRCFTKNFYEEIGLLDEDYEWLKQESGLF